MHKHHLAGTLLMFVVIMLCIFGLLAACAKTNSGTRITTSGATGATSLGSYGRELGIVVDQNLTVLEVSDRLAAAVAGVQPGDQLKTLNDVAFVGNREKIREIVGSGMTLILKVERAGKEIIVEVDPAHTPPFPTLRPGEAPLPTRTPVWPPSDYY